MVFKNYIPSNEEVSLKCSEGKQKILCVYPPMENAGALCLLVYGGFAGLFTVLW